MQFWRNTRRDAALVLLCLVHFATMIWLAITWDDLSLLGRVAAGAILVLMNVYDIIVVTHIFTHTPWFRSRTLNSLASMLCSLNIAQSAQVYSIWHVRNHHRYNNDRKGPDGKTRDTSSTYQDGTGGAHASLWRYAVVGAVSTLVSVGAALLSFVRLFRISRQEHGRFKAASVLPPRRTREIRQIQLDRFAHFAGVCVFCALSWQYTLTCYLPALLVGFAAVNVHNYYEHYGADPERRHADSVSYYGRLYNLIAFNDGYHQEHHLQPHAHWSQLPAVKERHAEALAGARRVVSPVPAMIGFLHTSRPPVPPK